MTSIWNRVDVQLQDHGYLPIVGSEWTQVYKYKVRYYQHQGSKDVVPVSVDVKNETMVVWSIGLYKHITKE